MRGFSGRSNSSASPWRGPQPAPYLTQNFQDNLLTALHAIGYANTPVPAAGDGEAGDPGTAVTLTY